MAIESIRLGVNVDHVATIRQARHTRYPDPVLAASLAELAGADQITIHLREDRRHIQDSDLFRMRDAVQTRLNLEMAVSEDIAALALKARPDIITLVPERREELTTEGGLDVDANLAGVKSFVQRMTDNGIPTSLFVEPSIAAVRAAKVVGAAAIELHTGRYCETTHPMKRADELMRIRQAAGLAKSMGLKAYAGHGLDYTNVGPIAQILDIEELNIGHSIVARALMVGMQKAVEDMRKAMDDARNMALQAGNAKLL
jgi:pyridoxine 5-phosphate synthase